MYQVCWQGLWKINCMHEGFLEWNKCRMFAVIFVSLFCKIGAMLSALASMWESCKQFHIHTLLPTFQRKGFSEWGHFDDFSAKYLPLVHLSQDLFLKKEFRLLIVNKLLGFFPSLKLFLPKLWNFNWLPSLCQGHVCLIGSCFPLETPAAHMWPQVLPQYLLQSSLFFPPDVLSHTEAVRLNRSSEPVLTVIS